MAAASSVDYAILADCWCPCGRYRHAAQTPCQQEPITLLSDRGSDSRTSMLYVFGGLPGTGKSALSLELARRRGAVHLRIDTIEQVLRECGGLASGTEGYRVAYRIADDNLRLGSQVVADSVNPLRITRDAWRRLARRSGSPFVEIEVICSSATEHRRRVESRSADVPGLRLPTWADVVDRVYEPWDRPRVVIDTAGRTVDQSFATLERLLARERPADR